jgi:hypothetical protein
MEGVNAGEVPERTPEDVVHGLVKAGLGPLGDLFGLIVRSPYERHLDDWMQVTEMHVRHLRKRDKTLFERLSKSDEFTCLFLAATQAAVRTARREKMDMLAAAVEQSASGTEIPYDIQMMFVRFVDELTPSHFTLLTFLADHTAALADVDSYTKLHSLVYGDAPNLPTEMEFKLLCNDLASRVLARFSAGLEDFGGLSGDDVVVSGERGGVYVVVTHLGHSILEFIGKGPRFEASDVTE